MLRRLWSGISRNVSTIVAVSSLVVAIITLIVSIVALKIADSSLSSGNQSRLLAEQSLILSSKDFTPVFEFDIDNKTGDVSIKNQMPTLYTIVSISVYKICERGFEPANSDSLVSFALLTKSAYYEDYHWKMSEDSSTIYVNLNSHTQLASMQKCYDENFIRCIDSYLDTYYSIDSPRGYALPSLHSATYLLDVMYRDRMGQLHSAYLEQEHIHGRGWWKQTIREDQFVSLLQQAEHKQIENMRDIDSIMAYFTENCKVSII